MKFQYKILYLSVALVFYITSLKAQIGVNTEHPRGIFHIDASGNTPSTGTPSANLILDDILVDNEGNLGVGTLSPETKLHIITGGTSTAPKTGLKIVDGNQANLKVFLSDANGIGRWADAPPIPAAIATKAGIHISSTETTYHNTGSYIALPPGRWLVTATTLMTASVALIPAGMTIEDKQWAHALFTENSVTGATGVPISPDVEGGERIAALITKRTYSVMTGSCVINNKTNANKKYYYAVGAFTQFSPSQGDVTYTNVAGTANSENSIIALLLQDEI